MISSITLIVLLSILDMILHLVDFLRKTLYPGYLFRGLFLFLFLPDLLSFQEVGFGKAKGNFFFFIELLYFS